MFLTRRIDFNFYFRLRRQYTVIDVLVEILKNEQLLKNTRSESPVYYLDSVPARVGQPEFLQRNCDVRRRTVGSPIYESDGV